MYDVSKNLKRLNSEIQVVKVFIKEQFVNVKNSIENVVVKIDNKENKEILDLIRQPNCALQKEKASLQI